MTSLAASAWFLDDATYAEPLFTNLTRMSGQLALLGRGLPWRRRPLPRASGRAAARLRAGRVPLRGRRAARVVDGSRAAPVQDVDGVGRHDRSSRSRRRVRAPARARAARPGDRAGRRARAAAHPRAGVRAASRAREPRVTRIWRALGLVALLTACSVTSSASVTTTEPVVAPVVGAADDIVPSGAPSGTERRLRRDADQ